MKTNVGRLAMKQLLAAVAAAPLAATAVITAPGAQADPASAAPSADQLTNQLTVILDTNAANAQRALYLQAGESALPAINVLAGPIAQHRSMVSLRVEDPTLTDDQVASQLVMSVAGMGSQRRPLTWIQQNGQWKLSNGSLCEVLQEFGRTSTCPV